MSNRDTITNAVIARLLRNAAIGKKGIGLDTAAKAANASEGDTLLAVRSCDAFQTVTVFGRVSISLRG